MPRVHPEHARWVAEWVEEADRASEEYRLLNATESEGQRRMNEVSPHPPGQEPSPRIARGVSPGALVGRARRERVSRLLDAAPSVPLSHACRDVRRPWLAGLARRCC